MVSLSGQTALITGGSKGIGAAAALLLARNGANIAINYSSDSSAAEDVVKQIGADKCIAIKGDAGSIPDIEAMVNQTVEKYGKIDILIPCAGVLRMRTLEQTSEEDFHTMMRVNVKGPYFLAQVRTCHSWREDSANRSNRKLFHTCPLVPMSSSFPPP